ncbi:hypothetical protein EDB83DRAFT_564762 [Lactarius deliciosus]|nr:hypothetical protein EDB83DRAFT_564762 [Lactarius deliciosus]
MLPLSVSFWRLASPSLAWCCWLSAASAVDGEGEPSTVAPGFRKYPILDQFRIPSPMSRGTLQCTSEPTPTSAGTDLCNHAVRPARLIARSAPQSIAAKRTCQWRTVAPPFRHHRYNVRQVDRRIASPFHIRMYWLRTATKSGDPLVPPASTFKPSLRTCHLDSPCALL